MDIHLQTKVGALLDAYPELEEVLLGLSPAFAKLKNPVLRRTVAKVATLRQAAELAGIDPAELIVRLRQAAGLTASADPETETQGVESGNAPSWLDEKKISVRFDATPVIEAGGSPMQDILLLAKELNPGEIFELTTPFKPAPIIDMLKSKGFLAWHKDGKTYFISPSP